MKEVSTLDFMVEVMYSSRSHSGLVAREMKKESSLNQLLLIVGSTDIEVEAGCDSGVRC